MHELRSVVKTNIYIIMYDKILFSKNLLFHPPWLNLDSNNNYLTQTNHHPIESSFNQPPSYWIFLQPTTLLSNLPSTNHPPIESSFNQPSSYRIFLQPTTLLSNLPSTNHPPIKSSFNQPPSYKSSNQLPLYQIFQPTTLLSNLPSTNHPPIKSSFNQPPSYQIFLQPTTLL